MRRLLLLLIVAFGISSGPAAAIGADAIINFHNAVRSGDVSTVRTMLATDPSLARSVDEYKFQPVHLLDMECNEEILDLLLANGADINARNDEGVTLLHIVTDPVAVDFLVRRGADIEAKDIRGWPPLMMQANNQDNGADVVSALLAHGANLNAKGTDGESALLLARQTGDEEFMKVLKSAGTKD